MSQKKRVMEQGKMLQRLMTNDDIIPNDGSVI